MTLRARAALSLLAGFAMLMSVRTLADALERAATVRSQQNMRAWQERLARVRPLLPEHAVLGFIPEEDTAGLCFTQYTLAPVVVLPGADRDLVLSTFEVDGKIPPPPSPRHELLLDDRQHGIMLWKAR